MMVNLNMLNCLKNKEKTSKGQPFEKNDTFVIPIFKL